MTSDVPFSYVDLLEWTLTLPSKYQWSKDLRYFVEGLFMAIRQYIGDVQGMRFKDTKRSAIIIDQKILQMARVLICEYVRDGKFNSQLNQKFEDSLFNEHRPAINLFPKKILFEKLGLLEWLSHIPNDKNMEKNLKDFCSTLGRNLQSFRLFVSMKAYGYLTTYKKTLKAFLLFFENAGKIIDLFERTGYVNSELLDEYDKSYEATRDWKTTKSFKKI